MKRCKACRAPIAHRRHVTGYMQWVDVLAEVCGAFCPAEEGRAHQPGEDWTPDPAPAFEVVAVITIAVPA